MKSSKDQNGFTLIEVLIALAVLSIGILAMMLMQVSAIKGNSTANTITSESNWAADRIEQILRIDFDDLDTDDDDGDGTNQDINKDGIDDDGGNFGLDDTGTSTAGVCTAAPADNCASEGLYDIFWNIALDNPIPSAIKIKVIVMHNQGKTNRVEYEYIKTKVN